MVSDKDLIDFLENAPKGPWKFGNWYSLADDHQFLESPDGNVFQVEVEESYGSCLAKIVGLSPEVQKFIELLPEIVQELQELRQTVRELSGE